MNRLAPPEAGLPACLKGGLREIADRALHPRDSLFWQWPGRTEGAAHALHAGLAGPGKVRVNKAGCLDRCAAGPVAVVYPEGTWYTFVDTADIDEIVDSHLVNGVVVERLLTPPHLGR